MNRRKPIKPKTKAFVDKLVNNPKMTYTDAYLETHDTTNRNVAAVEGSRLANSPAVMEYMEKHTDKAQNRIVELMKQDDDKRLAFDASRDVLDRVFGKATQKVEQTSVGVTISIDLS